MAMLVNSLPNFFPRRVSSSVAKQTGSVVMQKYFKHACAFLINMEIELVEKTTYFSTLLVY